MSIKILVTVDKNTLQESMYCGIKGGSIATNCAIAVAVRTLLPDAIVLSKEIIVGTIIEEGVVIPLPQEAQDFIEKFDSLKYAPKERLNLPEISFEIEIPENLIEDIGIEEITSILEKSPTMELAD